MVLACSPRHALAGSASVRARELDGERLVAFDETLALRREVDRELKRKRVEMQVVLSFDNIETIKRAVEIGEGVSLLPAPTVEREVQAGSLVAVRLADLRLTRRLGIIHRKNGELPRAARCFLELLREEAKAGEDGSADVSVAAAGGNGRVLPAEVTVG
jgi:DNA-binding transcriptional LysR family regulator